MDIRTICRLCAESNCDLHPIFTVNIVEKIEALVPIKIYETDDLPKNVCSKCVDKINEAYDFRNLVLETEEKLWLHVSTPKLDIKSELDDEIGPHLIKTDVSENGDFDDAGEIEPERKPRKKPRDRRSNPAFSSVCHKCGKVLKRSSFSDHMMNVHGQEATFECDVCGKMLKTRRQLWHHKRAHKREEVSCDKCGKVFTTKAGFKRHYNNIHLGIRNHSCNLCEKMFPRLMALKRHMRTHTGERPYSCPYCSRSFGGRWNLKQHVRLHTKEKPYKCQFCTEAFTQNVMLKSHMRNKHASVVDDDDDERFIKNEKIVELG